jgi:aryl-alcohol dehydrogenase-like predicted oxidoreductase
MTSLRIGLGLAALGRPGYINIGHADDVGGDRSVEGMELAAHNVFDAAYDAGVRYFDAARSYGRAERFLSTWIVRRGLSPRDLTVASKWGYTYTANWRVDAETHEVKNHVLPVLVRQFAESRALLGDHLKVYQIHSATIESGVLRDAGVIDELARLRDSGLVIGLSVSGSQQAETISRALDVRRGHERVFASVQATWNVLERGATDALIAAHDAGLRVVVKEALANGRLTARGIEGDPSLAVLRDEASRIGTTPDVLALAFVLAQPWADIVLSGAATVSQLESNVFAAKLKILPDSAERLATLVVSSVEYWRARSALAWN